MKIALIGNQNSGKTTLFNILTGMNAKVGNWPGVTIEKKTGIIKGTNNEIVDLPGIYSLSPYSEEEEISRKYLFNEKPNVIINIVDSTSIERSLYLTTQLLELDAKVIVALNMTDILEKKGIKIDVEKIEKFLGTKVIKISALKGTGIKELINEVNTKSIRHKEFIYDATIEYSINQIEKLLPKEIENKRFLAVKLLENDERFNVYNSYAIKKIISETLKYYDTDLEEIIATQRYEYVEKVKRESTIINKPKETLSDKLDKIFLNRWFAFPIFVLVMFLIYYLSVGLIGKITADWMEKLLENFSEFIRNVLISIRTSEKLISLVVDGIIVGVGSVLGFVPQLVMLFICISFLETSGYMARIALLLDKTFRKIGLSGKSLIPFIVGSGCSVPGIMGTRIIENNDEKEMTTLLVPFIPCSAKLPIIALLSGCFFGKYAGLVSALLYFLAILIIVFSAIILKKFIFKHTSSTYISELPEYKLPSIRYIIKDVWDKTISFIKRAGSVILICSIIIWFLLSFSFKLEYGVNIEDSMLASIGKTISWIFYPMIGKNSWAVAVSSIQGIVAKEQVISSMTVISGLSNEVEIKSQIFKPNGVFSFFTSSSALAFMVFNLFSAPCFGAIGAMKKEFGSVKKLIYAVLYQTILAWTLSTIIYQVGIKIEKGSLNFANILIFIIIFALITKILLRSKNKKECRYCPYCNACNKT